MSFFCDNDERQFKQQFAIQFMANVMAGRYAMAGVVWTESLSRPPAEDAEYLAVIAWSEWKERVGVVAQETQS